MQAGHLALSTLSPRLTYSQPILVIPSWTIGFWSSEP
jgi:hypothetical protein